MDFPPMGGNSSSAVKTSNSFSVFNSDDEEDTGSSSLIGEGEKGPLPAMLGFEDSGPPGAGSSRGKGRGSGRGGRQQSRGGGRGGRSAVSSPNPSQTSPNPAATAAGSEGATTTSET